MGFNNGLERVRLENRWKKLRVQYRAAGMSEEAIQAMYEFDLDVLNNERAYVDNTVTVVPSHAMTRATVPVLSNMKMLLQERIHTTKQKLALHGLVKSRTNGCRLDWKNSPMRSFSLSHYTSTRNITRWNYLKFMGLLSKILVSEF